MEKGNFNKMNKLKSEKGFTMQDLIVAILIFTIFTGIICTTMYKVYELNVRVSLTAQMTMYAVQILEDIDKISYEEAQTKTAEQYKEQFSIPAGFKVDLKFSNYKDGEENIQDVIKIVNLSISYDYLDSTENINIQKLKIKEM